LVFPFAGLARYSGGVGKFRQDSYIPDGIFQDMADNETTPVLIRNAYKNDLQPVISIYNYYVENGFAAYPQRPVPDQFFYLLGQDAYSFIVAEREGRVVGFGVAKPFLPFVTFSRVSAVSLYIHHDHLRQGIGKMLLEFMTGVVKARGVSVLLVNISSKNEEGLLFHQNLGFVECGRFHAIGMKNGELFDMVWLEKQIDEQG
jgi:L-amino acid N-acyltransferase YncA